MTDNAAPLVVRALEAGVRPVNFRLPFKFGATTLRACPQLFVRATVQVMGHGTAHGFAAEMMVPGWFDKRTERDAQKNVQDLARSFDMAAQAYVGDTQGTAFDLFARHYSAIAGKGVAAGMTALSAAFGQAVADRAVIDALCRALQAPFIEVAKNNGLGLRDCDVAADLQGFDWKPWLGSRTTPRHIAARHTIGMLDPLNGPPFQDTELPVHLSAIIERYGHRFFKIKLGGELQADLQRLREVLSLLDVAAPGYFFTLDGNEQYPNLEALDALIQALMRDPVLQKRPAALLYLEQPTARERSFDRAIDAPTVPLLIDEADDSLAAFPLARDLGWTGVSSKGCKGIYKSIINAARCTVWNAAAGAPRFFMSAEDLCCQAGLAVQQDLAIGALLQLTHAERNGHHYVDGMLAAPPAEADAFARAHPDLYEGSAGHPRLRIKDGELDVRALLGTRGFAHAADPFFDRLSPLKECESML